MDGYFRLVLSALLAVGWQVVTSAAPTKTVVGMTWNIYECQGWEQAPDNCNTNALDLVTRIIRKNNPDWVCLQEIDTASAEEAGHDQVVQLSKRLGFHPAFAGVFKHRHGGKWGNAILSRQKPDRVRSVPLPKKGKGPGRNALIAEFPDSVVCCTHLALEEFDRLSDVEILLRELGGSDKPVFLCGDLNAKPEDAPIRRLKTHFTVVSKEAPTCPSTAKEGKGACIDYILLDTRHAGSFRVDRQLIVDDRKASDHRAVVVKLSQIAPVEACDIIVYGSTPAAISAAVQAKRMGKTCVVVSPETRIGGLTTGGLGQTDIGNKKAFGGLALEFYRAVADYYRDEANWKWQKHIDYLPDGQCAGTKGEDSMWTFEPSAALKILEGWERRDGLRIVRGRRLCRAHGKVKVEKTGRGVRRIVSFLTEDGAEYRGRMFVDATYEGDLMAAAGVSYHVGREANAQYGETLNGTQVASARFHQFENGVDPYVVPGDPKSGLLPNVEAGPIEKDGTGDRRVQAYCFRMCLTDVPENRIPFAKPDGYDVREYELLFRMFAAKPANAFADGLTQKLPWINSKMPNRKTDTNNRDAFSTDFIGRNWNWPEASYSAREKIRAEHLRYQRGLMWTLANHPRVPEAVRREVSKWGTCKDEFADGLGNGWQTQLYVREARRMVGDYVMSEADCTGRRIAPRPVAMAAYQMDSHNVRRYVGKDGFVHNEGDVEVSVGGHPFPIDYGAIVPRADECGNLFVPVCLSATHIAFGSIRMEPVFFALGQAAATAAALAIDAHRAVQDLAYGPLADRLRADGQVLARDDR